VHQTLASFLSWDESLVRERYGHEPSGKARLFSTGLEMSLSHSREFAVLAVSKKASVGVDLEFLDRASPYLQIAQRFFHEEEIQSIQSARSNREARVLFLRLWTLKEAIFKTLGASFLDQAKNYSLAPWAGQSSGVQAHDSAFFSLKRLGLPVVICSFQDSILKGSMVSLALTSRE
jgi:phosphopantetheinyl transferase